MNQETVNPGDLIICIWIGIFLNARDITKWCLIGRFYFFSLLHFYFINVVWREAFHITAVVCWFVILLTTLTLS